MSRSDYRFSRKPGREATGLSDTQLRLHLERLVQMEYLLVHRGSRGQSFEYELLYDGAGSDERAFVPGLIEPDALRAAATTMTSSRGETVQFAGSSRPQRGAIAAGSRPGEFPGNPIPARDADETEASDTKSHISRQSSPVASYPQPLPLAAGAR